jgi:hypothetical protein
MAATLITEVNFIKQITLFSDRCSIKDLDKMKDDFDKDLLLNKKTTKAFLGRYLKNNEKTLAPVDEPVDGESQNGEASEIVGEKEKKSVPEQIISRNPKINHQFATGFSNQIKNNPTLLQFKLVYYRMSSHSWKILGGALGKTKTLQTLTLQACCLDEGENMQMLFKGVSKNVVVDRKEDRKGLQCNTSIETLDFNDNNLTCDHGQLICEFMKR